MKKFKQLLSRQKFILLSLTVSFFILGLLTLPHYGINWDTINHLPRGQAYLHYFLTGEKDYTKLKPWNEFRQKDEEVRQSTINQKVPRLRLYQQKVDTIFFVPDIPKSEVPRISMYQNVNNDFSFFIEKDGGGHPPLSDISTSVFNLVFFQKLGILNDIDSYRAYGVLLASFLVGLIFYWTASVYGIFAGIVAGISLALYPLFWSELHFNNEKDIPETVYLSFMLFAVWKGVTTVSWRWIVASGVFFGLALGTKFNVLFAIFIILPWLFLYLLSKKVSLKLVKKFFHRQKSRGVKFIAAFGLVPILGFSIFFVSWPYLWSDPVSRIAKVLNFYRTIGVASNTDSEFLGPLGVSTYPIFWILYTTPVVILFLTSIGIFGIFAKKLIWRDQFSMLLIFWLIIPIMRVTWPGVNIYGGIRHIMEFIPALAILSGIGAMFLRDFLRTKVRSIILASVLVLILFIPITIKLIEIHPNENVYFNPLIGGLKGAKDHDFPAWGVSFGTPYRQAVNWINQNVEPGARISLTFGLPIDIPTVFLRPDINLKNAHRSGYLKGGEYLISLVFRGSERRSYMDMYANVMLAPIYTIDVDGVSILKVWKNDKNHTKVEWNKDQSILADIDFEKNKNNLIFDTGDIVKLSRLKLSFGEDSCPTLEHGYIEISKDKLVWERLPGVIPEEMRILSLGKQPKDGKLIEPFVGQEARYIKFTLIPEGTCLMNVEDSKLYYFSE